MQLPIRVPAILCQSVLWAAAPPESDGVSGGVSPPVEPPGPSEPLPGSVEDPGSEGVPGSVEDPGSEGVVELLPAFDEELEELEEELLLLSSSSSGSSFLSVTCPAQLCVGTVSESKYSVRDGHPFTARSPVCVQIVFRTTEEGISKSLSGSPSWIRLIMFRQIVICHDWLRFSMCLLSS